ncbi:MAG TPA: hypothetical protein VMR51_02110, partial [Patescibacteria group bacterium]|nr:hypothetical protein [Patescibacteria group bacterium]
PAGSIQMQNTPQTQEVLNNNTESSNSTSTEAKQWGDGTYEVGKDIPTGVYVANGSNCYWQISRDSNGQQPIQNNFGNGQQIVTLTDAGTFFKVSNCPFTARQ